MPPVAPPTTTPTDPRPHGAPLRGLERATASSTRTGRFGRMFRQVPIYEHDPLDLIALGNTMIQRPEPVKESDPKGPKALDKPLDGKEDEDENDDTLADGSLRLPAGYTYFGQFVDHDITFDPVSSLTRQNDPDALTDFRTPRFDLDSLYGAGQASQPYLYEADGVRLRLGPHGHDLQRNGDGGRALIGDPRNDENIIVSQLQVTFIKFHNAVVSKLEKDPRKFGCDDLFKRAQQTVRWHYQWVVIHDFLPRIVGDAVIAAYGEREVSNRVVDDILRREAYASGDLPGANGPAIVKPHLLFYEFKEEPFMPVEFSVAAYRFGHSMARPSYMIRDGLGGPGFAMVDKNKIEVNRIPLFDVNDRRPPRHRDGCHPSTPVEYPGDGPDKLSNLSGFRPLPEGVRVDWKYLLPAIGEPRANLPQPSYKIDTTLGLPLGRLPDNTAKAQPLYGKPESDAQSLPVRNLLRGLALGVPAGQDVARAMGIKPLDVLPGPDKDGNDPDEKLRGLLSQHKGLDGNWPLWYYVLKEAERTGGHHLGPVGGRIVAEVLIGLLAGDRLSYLSVAPSWMPDLIPGQSRFTLSDLVNVAENGVPA